MATEEVLYAAADLSFIVAIALGLDTVGVFSLLAELSRSLGTWWRGEGWTFGFGWEKEKKKNMAGTILLPQLAPRYFQPFVFPNRRETGSARLSRFYFLVAKGTIWHHSPQCNMYSGRRLVLLVGKAGTGKAQ
jgi:hypothetical protein